jgi:hypothetical protein
MGQLEIRGGFWFLNAEVVCLNPTYIMVWSAGRVF